MAREKKLLLRSLQKCSSVNTIITIDVVSTFVIDYQSEVEPSGIVEPEKSVIDFLVPARFA